MYGKHYAAMYSGSMVGSGATVFAVWGYIIAHTRVSDNSIEINPRVLATIIGEPVEAVEKAVVFLCSPDKHSRSQEEEGRRLLKEAPFLYKVVNFAKYNSMKDEDARREYMRLYMKERRKKGKQQLTGVNNGQTDLAHAEANAPTNEEAKIEQQQPSSPDGEGDREDSKKCTGRSSEDQSGSRPTRQSAKAVSSSAPDQTATPSPSSVNSESANGSALASERIPRETWCLMIYNAYPRKVGKDDAIKAIEKVLKFGRDPATVLQKTKEFAASKLGNWKGMHDPWHPATFFNQGHLDDDPNEWERQKMPDGPASPKPRPIPSQTVWCVECESPTVVHCETCEKPVCTGCSTGRHRKSGKCVTVPV